jgi:hypothetical protein
MNEQRDEREKRPRLNLTTSQVAASALAACCASVVASYLGVAGTVIGAAVGSIVATTGAAVYGHLFRRGSARLRSSLQFNGRIPDGAEAAEQAGGPGRAEVPGAVTVPGARTVPGGRGRFYSAPQAGTAQDGSNQDETRPAGPGGRTTARLWLPASSASSASQKTQTARAAQTARLPENARIPGSGAAAQNNAWAAGTARMPQGAPAAAEPALFGGALAGDGRRPATATTATTATTYTDEDASGAPRPAAVAGIRRYRKPIGVAAAIVAVFCVSITVGFLAGAPVRDSGSNSTPPATTSTRTQDTQGAQGGGQSSGAEPSPSASATPSASPSGTPSPSSAGTSSAGTPSAPPSATAGATVGGATATGQPNAGTTDTDSNAP